VSQREDRPEIGVGRDDDPFLHLSQSENRLIVGGLKSSVAYMDRVVLVLAQALGDDRG
jgi:hypothetical protein